MQDKINNVTPPPNEIVFYECNDGKISIAVRFENENIWLVRPPEIEIFGDFHKILK